MGKGFDEWWVINGLDLMLMLTQAHEGGDPEMIYLEHYANSEHKDIRGDEECPPNDN